MVFFMDFGFIDLVGYTTADKQADRAFSYAVL